MTSTTNDSLFMLIETPVTHLDVGDDRTQSVYSILALYQGDDFADTCFVYDVSREKAVAEYVLAALKVKKPSKDTLYDAVSELL